MKAFISYSINDSEQYVLSLLSNKLRERGFSPVSNFYGRFATSVNETMAAMKIKESSLFIGVITSTGLNHEKVIAEHNMAVSMNVPALLLIEDNIQPPLGFTNYNVIFFNRSNPHIAIERINKNIQNVGNLATSPQKNSNNAVAWLLGGLALIGLIDNLSSSRN
jgi:hypothetical protein